MKPAAHHARLVLILLVALPPLATAAAIALYGVAVPYFDQWDLVELILKERAGTATFADYFQQHSEHRFVLPRFIMAKLAIVTGWNSLAELWLGYLFVVATLAGSWALIRSVPLSSNQALICLAIASSWHFSLGQWENWIWGWQLSWFITNAAVVGATVCLAKLPYRVALPSSIACAAVASFSAAHGLLVWFALLPMVLASACTIRRRWIGGIAWFTAGFTVILIYTFNFSRTHPVLSGGIANRVVSLVTYSFMVIGGLGSRQPAVALILGVALVVVALWLAMEPLRNRCSAEYHSFTSLILFAILFALANAWGRAPLGLEQALASRYATPASLLVIGSIPLLFLKKELHGSAAGRLAVLAGLLVPLTAGITALPIIKQQARLREDARLMIASTLFTSTAKSRCSPGLYPNAEQLRQNVMKLHHAGVWQLPTPETVDRRVTRARAEVVQTPSYATLSGFQPENLGRTLVAASLESNSEFVDCSVVGPGDQFTFRIPRNTQPEELRILAFDARRNSFRQYHLSKRSLRESTNDRGPAPHETLTSDVIRAPSAGGTR